MIIFYFYIWYIIHNYKSWFKVFLDLDDIWIFFWWIRAISHVWQYKIGSSMISLIKRYILVGKYFFKNVLNDVSSISLKKINYVVGSLYRRIPRTI